MIIRETVHAVLTSTDASSAKSRGAMALYLYAAGSPFELRLTNEMINGGGIRASEFKNGFGDPFVGNDTLAVEEIEK